MRLPYAPPSPPAADADAAAAYAAVSARRAPRPLQPLDLTLLHSPPVATGWNAFLGAVRTQTSLAASLRELLICRVAALNGAAYEWDHHAPLALQAGVSEEGMRTVREAEALRPGGSVTGRSGRGLAPKEWAALDFADQSTRHVAVDGQVFRRLRDEVGSDREVVEVTATVAAYNCVSRFLVALDVGEANARAVGEAGEGGH